MVTVIRLLLQAILHIGRVSKSISLYCFVMAVLLRHRLYISQFDETDGLCVAFICTVKALMVVRPLQVLYENEAGVLFIYLFFISLLFFNVFISF